MLKYGKGGMTLMDFQSRSTDTFFSIVIPTKNRSFLVKYAIQSVLNQSFKDFEIIIADNDDTEETKYVIKSFQDSRIRYYRSGNLSMPDNWDYGCEKINGKYLLIVEDRMALKPHALEKIYNVLLQTQSNVVVWGFDWFFERYGTGIHDKKLNGNYYRISSNEIVKSFLDLNMDFFLKYSPRGLNSCVSRDIVNKIYNGPFYRLCPPVAPDYTMCFQVLNEVDNIIRIDQDLFTSQGLEFSNGGACFLKNNGFSQFIKELKLRETDLYTRIPLKLYSPTNLLLNDYFTISEKSGGKLVNYHLNLLNYYISIYEELTKMREAGVDIHVEMDIWYTSLYKNNLHFQKLVLDSIKKNHPWVREYLKILYISLIKLKHTFYPRPISLIFDLNRYDDIIDYVKKSEHFPISKSEIQIIDLS